MKVVDVPLWWEFTCTACGATCQADVTDVVSRPNVDSEGDTVGVIPVVCCGHCGKKHDVPERLLTEKIREIAVKSK